MPAEKENYNSVQLIGNLGADPEIRYFESGSRVCECRIAVYAGKDKSGEPLPPDWWTIKAWNAAADAMAEFRQGNRMQIVEGNLKLDKWNDRETGKERTKPYVLAWKLNKIERQPKPAESIPNANTGVYDSSADYSEIPF